MVSIAVRTDFSTIVIIYTESIRAVYSMLEFAKRDHSYEHPQNLAQGLPVTA
jgi:hypothetical protein